MKGYPLKDLAAKVYRALRDAGPQGLLLREVAQRFPNASDKALHQQLTRMRKKNLIKFDGKGSRYRVTAECDVPTLRADDPCAQLLELIADCPSGISVDALHEETGMPDAWIRRLLQPEVDAGRLARITLPARHGGGSGYQKVDQAAVVQQLLQPGPQAAADDVRGAFELLDQARLAIAWDGARIVLPQDVTRGLFRFLDALQGVQRELPTCG